MKSKRLLIVLITVITILFSFSVIVRAEGEENTTKNSGAEVVSEIPEDELIPELEEKLKKEQEEKNNKSDSEEVEEEEEENTEIAPELDVISSDVHLLETDEKKLENLHIQGNVYAVGENIRFINCEVDGDVVLLCGKIEFKNTKVSGSVYGLGSEINVQASTISSFYAVAEKIVIDKDTVIERDFNVASAEVYVDGTVERDLFVVADYAELGDDSLIKGKCKLAVENYELTLNAEVPANLDVEYIDYINYKDYTDLSMSEKFSEILPELATEFVIILVIAIIILGISPKFTEVNKKLRKRDFIKAFFTGILEIIIFAAVAVGLMVWGYGTGYAILILNLIFTFLALGEIIFAVSLAVRIVKNSGKASKVKAFLMLIVIAFILEVFKLISILGFIGLIIRLVVDLILGIIGFGTLVRIAISSVAKKEENKPDAKIETIEFVEDKPVEVKPEEIVEPEAKKEEKPKEEPVKEEPKKAENKAQDSKPKEKEPKKKENKENKEKDKKEVKKEDNKANSSKEKKTTKPNNETKT